MPSSVAGALLPSLVAFAAVATHEHVTRGADVLGVPQSSVSRRLRQLEGTLGVTLFVSTGRGVTLTAQGRALLARLRGPLHALDAALTSIVADADPDTGLVRFGFPRTLGPTSVPDVLARFHDDAPGIRLVLRQAHGSELLRALRDGELDVAIVIPPPLDLPSTILGQQPLLLHVGRGHRLAARTRVLFADLYDEVFIAPPADFHLRWKLESLCAAAGFTPNVMFEITELETLRALVARDLGVALLPPGEAHTPGVVAIDVRSGGDARTDVDATARAIALVSSPTPTAAARRLHDFLAAHAPVPRPPGT